MSIIEYKNKSKNRKREQKKMCRTKKKGDNVMTNTMTRPPRFEITVNPQLMDIKWGDVVYVNFGKNEGSEQNGVRPAIIIQNDKGNEHAPTTIVACITSEEKRYLPTHVYIKPWQSGLEKMSTIMFEQIRTIDKSRIISKVGHINTDWLVEKIKKSLTISFGMV